MSICEDWFSVAKLNISKLFLVFTFISFKYFFQSLLFHVFIFSDFCKFSKYIYESIFIDSNISSSFEILSNLDIVTIFSLFNKLILGMFTFNFKTLSVSLDPFCISNVVFL